MIDNSTLCTCMSSLTMIILKEVRLERYIKQTDIALACEKRSPSAWAKIETGRTPLSLDMLFGACAYLQLPPSVLFSATERYMTLLRQYGWTVGPMALDSNEDHLLNESAQYYNSPGFKNKLMLPHSVLYGPPLFGAAEGLVPVFRFCLDPQFKKQQLEYKPVMIGPMV